MKVVAVSAGANRCHPGWSKLVDKQVTDAATGLCKERGFDMQFRYLALVGILLAGLWTLARAEQGCPDGFMPNAAGTPGLQCIQIPGQTRPGMDVGAQAEPNWQTRWGAIAYDPEHGSVGISSEQISRRKAVKGALAHCKSKGGVACALNIAYYNQCVAVVSGPSPAGSGVLMNSVSAATKQEAEKLSTETCVKDTQAKCTTFYTGCSYPVRGD